MVCAQARLAQTASCFLEASEARRSWSRAEEEASEAFQSRQREPPRAAEAAKVSQERLGRERAAGAADREGERPTDPPPAQGNLGQRH